MWSNSAFVLVSLFWVWLELVWKYMKTTECQSRWSVKTFHQQHIQTKHMWKLTARLISWTFCRHPALKYKFTWPTFSIFSAKRSIRATTGNMKIFHLTLPILRRAGKLINALHICIESSSVSSTYSNSSSFQEKTLLGRWWITENMLHMYYIALGKLLFLESLTVSVKSLLFFFLGGGYWATSNLSSHNRAHSF